MNKQKWKKIKSIFEQALSINSEQQRLALIKKESNGDQEVIQHVQEMIATELSDITSTNILSKEAANFVGNQWEFSAGDQVGAFEIKKKIAEGGMGAVFLAERADEVYTQKVAIKAIRPHILNKETLERFNTERQILADLNHPNIASLIDGGKTGSGIPYYVMEYIDGLPLLEYAAKNSLNVNQRLKLFQKICAAVEYAHQHLVIHRDIKTGNVLITENNELKLLDFGIAKIMDAEHLDLALTRVDQSILTPENASPEQVRGEGITTATDIYMLGVLLYQLLSNNKPFSFKTNSILEVEKVVCNSSPLKPSQNVKSNNEHSDIIKLSERLKGDLDNIILKAMAREPQERYQSSGQLSDDIDRYLNHQPIMAKPSSWFSKSKKFVRRNRLVVSLATLVIAVIVGFSIFVSLQAIQLKVEKNRALLAETKALQKSEIAEKTSEFMVGIFATSDPRQKGTQFTSAKDLLDNALNQLTEGKIKDKVIRQELLFDIGLAYRNLGEYDVSNKVLEETLALSIDLFGEVSLKTAEIKVRLGDSYRTDHQYDKAYVLLKSAIDIQSQFRPPASFEIADAYNNLALVVHGQGKIAEAVELQEKSVNLHLQYTNEHSEKLAIPFYNLSLLYRQIGHYSKAIKYAGKAISIDEKIERRKYALANSLLVSARLHRSIGEYQVALSLFKRCKKMKQIIYGDKHSSLAMIDRDMAITYQKMGKYDQSETLFLSLEERLLRNGSREQINYVVWEFYFSLLLKDKGQYVEAEKRMNHSIEVQIKKEGEGFPRVVRYQQDLAELLILNGKLKRAETLLNRLLKWQELNQPSNQLQIGLLHYSFISLYSAKGELDKRRQSENAAKEYFKDIDPKAEENKQLQIRLNNQNL